MKKTREYALLLAVVLSASAIFITIGMKWPDAPECAIGSGGRVGALGKAFRDGGECTETMVTGIDKKERERRHIEELKERIREEARRKVCAEPQTSAEAIERCQQATEYAERPGSN